MNAPLGSCGASWYLTDATARRRRAENDKCVLADYNMRASSRPTDLVLLSSTIVRVAHCEEHLKSIYLIDNCQLNFRPHNASGRCMNIISLGQACFARPKLAAPSKMGARGFGLCSERCGIENYMHENRGGGVSRSLLHSIKITYKIMDVEMRSRSPGPAPALAS